MRTAINSAVAYLRSMRPVIPDGMIERLSVSPEINLTLVFPTEEELATFGSNNLIGANVEKISGNELGIFYKATLIWRRRTITINMRVDSSVGVPANRIFSGEPIK